jgi:hypothetical protein
VACVRRAGRYAAGERIGTSQRATNPTGSFRTRAPLRVIGEITDWKGHTPEQVQAMKDGLARLAAQGVEAIED